jgi:hypothetical protein
MTDDQSVGDPPPGPATPTAYRLPTGRIVSVPVAGAPPWIRYEVAPGHVVVAIRADLREPF